MRRQRKKAQVFAEVAIIMPAFILFLVCFIQLCLLMQAKFVVDYAAFCAARAGVVYQADMTAMKEAASFALAPIYERIYDEDSGTTNANWLTTSQKVQLIMTDSINPNPVFPIRLYLLNDNGLANRIEAAESIDQLSQDDRVLKVRLEYDYPLLIPIASKILSQLYTGIIGGGGTIDGDWMTNSGTGFEDEVIPLSSTCYMRITTLTAP